MNDVTVARAGWREWTGLAVLALPTLLVSMDLTVLHLAVPHLTADLAPSGTQLLWIVDIYAFLVAGLLITMGTLGDRIGRRRLLLAGAAAFGVASVLAAYAGSAEMLIAARALLGIGGSTLMPSTMSLIRTMFHDDKQRTVAISVWMMSFMTGGAIGPLVAGFMLESFWWGSVFLPAVPVMVLLLALGPVLLPEYRDPSPGRVDPSSVLLSIVSVLALVYCLKQIAADGLSWQASVSFAVGLVAGVVFVRRQMRLAYPLIDVRLFRDRVFTTSVGTLLVSIMVMMGVYFFTAQYLQLVEGLSALEAGLWTLPSTAAGIAGTMVAPALLNRLRPVYVISGGIVVAIIGLAMLTQVGTSGLALIITGSAVLSIGIAPATVLGTDMIVGAAPAERAGAASAVSETSSELGGALGIAVLGSIATAAYQSRLTDTIPAGLAPEAADTALNTLGGALETATDLPARLGDQLVAAAHGAFVHGLHVIAVVSIITMAVFAASVAVVLRRLPSSSAGQEQAIPSTAEPKPR
ncbi:DHA2 family multidrug resistance protein-like MFS transporter [Thermocatellispora tengchongensis]|uniref:DHA2 family multidrug resistance protein-like MFS transporter n=1 Tax=Thermocatellispora tengchongensis TaxID=1073253 RepID=A0A840P5V7_9ACTN|nr:MFS transporter [Thermocatellispora tengchongensis]MBB5132607.1 DHA2 family multidrug resistance protein-like MFS transporter [Thermocatellispora tengchongensis]